MSPPPDPKDVRVYDLSPLMQKDFDFIYDTGSGIEQVTIKKLRPSSRDDKRNRITLEADTESDSDAVYKLMKKISRSTPLDQYYITQVELGVQIAMDVEKKAQTATIRITHACDYKTGS